MLDAVLGSRNKAVSRTVHGAYMELNTELHILTVAETGDQLIKNEYDRNKMALLLCAVSPKAIAPV